MLEVTNLSVKYDTSDKNFALNNVNFTVKSGERVALIGANGAGKSTLLLTLCGVLSPISGEVSIDNTLLEKKSLHVLRQRAGMVFQNPDDQLFMPTVYEDITFGPRNYKLDDAEIECRADDVLNRLGISHLKERMTHKLSGGEKRMAALAGVLIMQPSLLLMDEPASFLDPRARRRLIGVLSGLSQAMIIATHDLDIAKSLCDRAVLLKEGRVFADRSVDALRNEELLDGCGL